MMQLEGHYADDFVIECFFSPMRAWVSAVENGICADGVLSSPLARSQGAPPSSIAQGGVKRPMDLVVAINLAVPALSVDYRFDVKFAYPCILFLFFLAFRDKVVSRSLTFTRPFYFSCSRIFWQVFLHITVSSRTFTERLQ